MQHVVVLGIGSVIDKIRPYTLSRYDDYLKSTFNKIIDEKVATF